MWVRRTSLPLTGAALSASGSPDDFPTRVLFLVAGTAPYLLGSVSFASAGLSEGICYQASWCDTRLDYLLSDSKSGPDNGNKISQPVSGSLAEMRPLKLWTLAAQSQLAHVNVVTVSNDACQTCKSLKDALVLKISLQKEREDVV